MKKTLLLVLVFGLLTATTRAQEGGYKAFVPYVARSINPLAAPTATPMATPTATATPIPTITPRPPAVRILDGWFWYTTWKAPRIIAEVENTADFPVIGVEVVGRLYRDGELVAESAYHDVPSPGYPMPPGEKACVRVNFSREQNVEFDDIRIEIVNYGHRGPRGPRYHITNIEYSFGEQGYPLEVSGTVQSLETDRRLYEMAIHAAVHRVRDDQLVGCASVGGNDLYRAILDPGESVDFYGESFGIWSAESRYIDNLKLYAHFIQEGM